LLPSVLIRGLFFSAGGRGRPRSQDSCTSLYAIAPQGLLRAQPAVSTCRRVACAPRHWQRVDRLSAICQGSISISHRWITNTGQIRTTTSLYKILRFLAWDGILCDMGKHTHIELTSEERTELEKLIRTGNAPARTHTRARILLLSDRSQGQKRTDQEVADAVLCCVTVGEILKKTKSSRGE
jgi:hypothetical protein